MDRTKNGYAVKVVHVAASLVSAAVGDDGHVYLWGDAQCKHLGPLDYQDAAMLRPVPLPWLNSKGRAVAVELGTQHAVRRCRLTPPSG